MLTKPSQILGGLLCVLVTYSLAAQDAILVSNTSAIEHSMFQEVQTYLSLESVKVSSDLGEATYILFGPENPVYSGGMAIDRGNLHRYLAHDSRKNIGLELSANYRWSSSGGIYDPDFDQGPRSYVQLGWNLLREGLLTHRRSAKAEMTRAEIKDLEKQEAIKNQQFKYLYNRIVAGYSFGLRPLLKKRLEYLEYLVVKSEERAFVRSTDYDEHLDYVRRRDETLRMLEATHHFIQGTFTDTVEFLSMDMQQLPLLDVDVVKLKDSLSGISNDHAIAQLSTRSLHEKYPWYGNYTLKPYIRYGLPAASLFGVPARGVMDAGVQLRIPLARSTMSKSDYQEQYAVNQTEQAHLALSSRWNEILSLYSELQMLLKQFRKLEIDQVKLKGKLRFAMVQSKFDQINHMYHLLQVYEALMEVQIELLDLKKRSYVRLLQMDRYMVNDSITNYLKLVPLYESQSSLVDLVVAEASDIIDYPPNFISSYLLKNHISELLVWVQSDREMDEVMSKLVNQDVKLSFLTDGASAVTKKHSMIAAIDFSDPHFDRNIVVPKNMRTMDQIAITASVDQIDALHECDFTPDAFVLKMSDLGELTRIPSHINQVPVHILIDLSQFTSRYDMMTYARTIKSKAHTIGIIGSDLGNLIELDRKENYKY